MKRRGHHIFTVVLAMCSMTIGAGAQSGRKPNPRPPTESPIARIETREVFLPLSAYDAEGNNVTDLAPKDLLVVENGEPRAITRLRREPASVVLVLDLSNEIGTFKNGASQRYSKDNEQRQINREGPVWARKYEIVPRPAAREFADNFVVGLPEDDEIAIIQYSDRVQLVQDWTRDRRQALDSLHSKYRVGLKARYYDALTLATEKLRDRSGRKVIVLLSDGLDSASRARRQQAVSAVEHSGAAVFVVAWEDVLRREITGAIQWLAHEGSGSREAKRIAELRRFLSTLEGAGFELSDLAHKSGGELVMPADFDQLVAVAPRSLNREIGAQSSLAFVTERGPSLEDERTVEVMSARPGLSVRARRVYYLGDAARQ
jgi:VWFA-related protein